VTLRVRKNGLRLYNSTNTDTGIQGKKEINSSRIPQKVKKVSKSGCAPNDWPVSVRLMETDFGRAGTRSASGKKLKSMHPTQVPSGSETVFFFF
jgi:hypothetical protein